MLPSVKAKIKSQMEKTTKGFRDELMKETNEYKKNIQLVDKGVAHDILLKKLSEWSSKEHVKWDKGQASGTVYHGQDEFTEFLSQAYAKFALSNPLHPDLFPFVRKMEAEIVSMTLHLFHGGERACGTLSSGGTESILLACKAYRDRAHDLYGITHPEMIAPVTIHAAFEKAAQYFQITLVHVPVDPKTMQACVRAVRAAITPNTILIAASAPNFAHGIIDPIMELAGLADDHGIGFHTDCCLGALLIPFLGSIGMPVPPFDFQVRGVTSISCDLHKYGYAPKGTSCIMYNDPDLRRFQYFSSTQWTGGIYASPTLAGSRPGALSASAWAAMMALGRQGYTSLAREIMASVKVIRDGIAEIPEIEIIGEPMVSVVAIRSATLNVYNINEAMHKSGWMLNALQNPPAVHICVTNLHTGDIAHKFVRDLKAAVNSVVSDPASYSHGSAAIYGMVAQIPDLSIVDYIARAYIDTLFAI